MDGGRGEQWENLTDRLGEIAVVTLERPYHLMAKPMGPVCNLDCEYCFYLEKEALFPKGTRFRMTEKVLEAYVRQYIESIPGPEVAFGWQGGEPMLRGLDFFRAAVRLQEKYGDGRRVTNALQTNGLLLNDEWCEFLAENRFLVGISLDGPARMHDSYRVDKGGKPTHDRVVAAIERLRKHDVEFNTLTVVSQANAEFAVEVYRYLKSVGSRYHQYIPLVERLPDARAQELSLSWSGPPDPREGVDEGEVPGVTSWSVTPYQFGKFLVRIFEEWVYRDVGEVFVNYFESTLASFSGLTPGMCVFQETCGRSVIMEHDGSVYSCDHYVYPEYRLGNVAEASPRELVDSGKQRSFGDDKYKGLPGICRRCEYLFACYGECPKHRFLTSPDGEPGWNYLCEGLLAYFRHVDALMTVMASLFRGGQPPAQIMSMLREQKQILKQEGKSAGRKVRRRKARGRSQ
jgi:uncharacterized protein